MTVAATANPAVIKISNLSTRFGEHVVLDDRDREVREGVICEVIGGSGARKSTLLREIIQLHRPDAGS
ncbi:MAG: ABC transporter ATP-binding protein, partial [Rhodocyclaceae bacterium]|nr:ABC transporter ATP-binding protein [Rhodocyclaceae bacterium]